MSDQAPVVTPVPSPVVETPNTETPTETPEVRRHKVKVDNSEVEVDESELIRSYSRSQASMKRFEDAAQLKKDAEGISAKFKADPIQALIDAGHSPEDIAEAIFLSKLQAEVPNEEDPEKAELKRYRDKEQKAKDETEAKEFNEKAQAYANSASEKIIEAMEGTGLSKDPYTVRAAALFIKSCLQQGFEPDAVEIRDAIEGRVRNDYASQVKGKKGQDLVDWLGEDTVNEIRRFDLSRLRPNRQDTPVIPQAKPQEAPQARRETKWDIEERMKKWSQS